MKRVLLLAVCAFLFLSACSAEESSSKENNDFPKDNQETPIKEDDSTPSDDGQLLLDDECVKVSYVEAYEEPSIDGAFYLRLEVENKTEKQVTVYLLDPSVNNVSTLALSGIPMVIQPGGKSLNPFFFTYNNLDISSVDELEEISFKVKVDDNETFDEIETSEVLSISFKAS